MASRATRVRCGDVELKLTLTAKQLDRPFDTAVIAPFLKAYSKKVGALEPVTLAQVSVVRVDDEQIGDLSLASSVVLLVSEVVETEIFLKTPAVTQESLSANPFGAVGGGVSGAQAAAGTVDFDGDERSAIEKLKDERRARRKAEGEGDSGFSVGDRVTVDGLTSETGRAINGEAGTLVRFVAESGRWEVRLDSQSERTFNLKSENLSQIVRFKESFNMKADAAAPAPAPAAPPAAAEGPPSAPFRVLEAAEETVGTLEVELASVRAAFDLIDVEDVEAADELDNVARRGTALVATAGRLQGELDELEFGGLEAAVRDEARAERRAVHARLEQLLPEASALQKRVLAARK